MPTKFKLLAGLNTAFLLFLSLSLFAQTSVTGRVLNTEKQPVVGATVQAKGGKSATLTGSDGTFSLTSSQKVSALLITIVGFESLTVPVRGNSVGDIMISTSTTVLNDIVVTGYSAQKRKEITGAISVVNVADMKSVPAATLEQLLQGQASGMNIISSGSPGEASNVFIRGITSFGNTDPLVVVDGVESAPGSLSILHDLSAQDIESVQVLKDAQSSIYGARGSAGVIIITTKRGKGNVSITYDGFYGTQVPLSGNPWHKANVQQMADLFFLAAKNSGAVDSAGNVTSNQYGKGLSPVLPAYIKAGPFSGLPSANGATDIKLYNNDYSKGPIYLIVPAAGGSGTDWFHEAFKPAPIMSHSITASGGSDKASYLFSLNYLDQKGTLLNTSLKRYAARINTNFNVANHVHIGENAYVLYKQNPRIGNNQEGNPVNTTAWEQPIIPVYDAGGGFGGTAGSQLGNSQSPIAVQTRAKDNQDNDWQVTGDVYVAVDFAKHFTVKTLFGGNFDNYYYFSHSYHTYENAENNGSNGYQENAGYNSTWNWTNTLSYKNIFAGKHNLTVLVGYESSQSRNRYLNGNRINYFSDDPNYLSLATGAPIGQQNYSQYSSIRIASFLAKLDYAFNDRYLLGVNFRNDGASVFGPASKYGNFGSVSAGWVVSREDFMSGVTFIDNLKFRGSWGVLGSIANVPQNNQYTLYGGTGSTSYYDLNGTSNSTVQGFYATTYGNLATSWEKDKILDFGLDATILKNKLDISFDWYKKTINGLLFGDQAAGVVGLGANLPQVNIGDMQNIGYDFSINYHTRISTDVNFNIGINAGHYTSTILNIPGAAGFFEAAGTHNTGNQVRNQTGHPVGAFFGYKIVGIYQDAADVAKSPKETDAAPGRFKYLDANGDGKISDSDRVFFGNPNPKFTAGINLGFSFKQFDFSAVFYWSYGNDVLNYTRYFQDFYPQFQNSKSAALLTDSWLPTRKNAKYPIVENGSYFSTNGVINDFYNEDGSYFRCKQMQIGYNFEPSLLKKAGIQKLRFYVQAANLFTITKYTGLDPELVGNARTFGVDYGNYPPSKTYIVGLSLTF